MNGRFRVDAWWTYTQYITPPFSILPFCTRCPTHLRTTNHPPQPDHRGQLGVSLSLSLPSLSSSLSLRRCCAASSPSPCVAAAWSQLLWSSTACGGFSPSSRDCPPRRQSSPSLPYLLPCAPANWPRTSPTVVPSSTTVPIMTPWLRRARSL